jgi:hypothetical protein
MKFFQVPMGQRFAFEGEVYVKTRPLTAACETGGNDRLIRRSADVELLTETARVAPPVISDSLESGVVRNAFDAFCTRCFAYMDKMDEDAGVDPVKAIRKQLEGARDEFLDELGLQ